MTTQALIALAALAMATLPATAGGTDALAAYRWHARVLVVSAPRPSDPRATEQRRIVEAATRGMHARDLVVVEALGEGSAADALRRQLGLPGDAFRAVLVGKDGGAKLVDAEPIPAARLFEIIDAMPMRRQEMGKP